jgi:hypothetical protein
MASTISTIYKFENDDELCWDCDEEFATHGHFCEECNNEPIMFRDPKLVKPGACRLCAEDDEQVKAFGSYGEDNVPMCEGCKEAGGFNSDGTRKGADNDSDEEEAEAKASEEEAKGRYRQWCKDNKVEVE